MVDISNIYDTEILNLNELSFVIFLGLIPINLFNEKTIKSTFGFNPIFQIIHFYSSFINEYQTL